MPSILCTKHNEADRRRRKEEIISRNGKTCDRLTFKTMKLYRIYIFQIEHVICLHLTTALIDEWQRGLQLMEFSQPNSQFNILKTIHNDKNDILICIRMMIVSCVSLLAVVA